MGLLDCVSDNSAKYPVRAVASDAPFERGMSRRRSMGMFSSTTSLRGKDIGFWRHRLLAFLFKGEGREDILSLQIPLKKLGYNTIGDFIRDIPSELYEPYKCQTPDQGLRKDYKVIWERDGIAEPGCVKWEGPIDDQRCMGLQLDRKKGVPFGVHDGKGLFYCKPGHRALVPTEEVYPYKAFLRQFLGMPQRKDSLPLNLLPGRSSVRVAVKKRYQPGDRVYLPSEEKWATILWTGRIDGEWVVDLVYDPEKPAKGRMVSPDDPRMSRSLSMEKFIDVVGPEEHLEGETSRDIVSPSPSPPRHVPPPPPKSSPPPLERHDDDDEVFFPIDKSTQSQKVTPRYIVDSDEGSSKTDSHEATPSVTEEEGSEDATSGDEHTDDEDIPAASQVRRVSSEPGPQQKELQSFEPLVQHHTLVAKTTHKPLLNLSKFGKKPQKEAERTIQTKSSAPTLAPSSNDKRTKGIGGFNLFSLGKGKKAPPQRAEEPTGFLRHDRSRSPVHRKPEKDWNNSTSDNEHHEVPVDVPYDPPHKPVIVVSITEDRRGSAESSAHSDSTTDSRGGTENTRNVEVVAEVNVPQYHEDTDDSYASDSPPYAPAVKDAGFQAPVKKKNSSSPFSFGLFSKKKTPPPRDYVRMEQPQPPPQSYFPERRQEKERSLPEEHADDGQYVELRPQTLQFTNRTMEPASYGTVEASSTVVELNKDGPVEGDQDFLTLESLEVKDDHWPHQQSSGSTRSPKRGGSIGKGIFSFTKRPKSTTSENFKSPEKSPNREILIIKTTSVSRERIETTEVKPKRGSLKDSFTRTFSLNKENKRKGSTGSRQESFGKGDRLSRPASTSTFSDRESSPAKQRASSTSVLVDIQPWSDRKGVKDDLSKMYDSDNDKTTGSSPQSPVSPKPPPALIPKEPDPAIPKHRIFTTPKGLFGFGSKSSTDLPKVTKKKPSSFKGGIFSSPAVKSPPPRMPASPPPRMPPPSPPHSAREPTTPTLKSAMKQRREIDAIPKGVKIGDHVVWYNGKLPVPGTVKKLYKDGTDKYTAVVKFDRSSSSESLSLAREGDDYIVTVEELVIPDVSGYPLPTHPMPTVLTSVEVAESGPVLGDAPKSPSVRFNPSPYAPTVSIEVASPIMTPTPVPLSPTPFKNERIAPPFQEEEIELACGVHRGIPSRDISCCMESLLFSMFYTNNAFDMSLLYATPFEKDAAARDIKTLLRDFIVDPLRQSGSCESSSVIELKERLQNSSTDFNSLNIDAAIMAFILFDRALNLGKFISYSNGVTDYLHQLVVDPKDFSTSNTIQTLFESSLKQMENAKLRNAPSPALIIEMPRANDKFVHYEAIVPNLNISLSHVLDNGPRLCICGVVAKYECLKCSEQSGDKALVYCDNCSAMSEQIHFQLSHKSSLLQLAQSSFSMDLVSVVCVKGGHYTAFVKCGSQRSSPWLFYDAAEVDNPKVSLEQNLGMWIERLERNPGKYMEAFVHPLLTHFLANSHLFIYKPREKSSLV